MGDETVWRWWTARVVCAAATLVLGCGDGARAGGPEVEAEFAGEDAVVQGPTARPWEEPPWPAWDGAVSIDAATDAVSIELPAGFADASRSVLDGHVEDVSMDHAVRDTASTDGIGPDSRPETDALASACEPRLRINEVLTGTEGEGGTAEEFVEVRNAGTCPVPLYGWTLRYLSATGASGRLLWSGSTERIAPGGYLVAGSAGVLARLAPDALATVFRGSGTSGLLSAAGGAVALFEPGGGSDAALAADSLGYAAAPTNPYVRVRTAPAPPPGRSLSRVSDRGDNSVDFAVSAAPTPGSMNR